MSSPPTVPDELAKLTSGLFFLSEADSPLEVVSCARPIGPLPSSSLLQALGEPPNEPVQVVALPYFLRQHTAPNGVLSDAAAAARYQDLQDFMEQQLGATQVYRVGTEPQIRAYALGQLGEQQLAGFKTLVIET